MDTKQLSRVQRKLKMAMKKAKIDAIGRSLGFTIRERVVTPHSLATSLICALAVLPVQSLADLHRAFVAMSRRDIKYKPFHTQLAKSAFPELMRQVLCLYIEHLALTALRPVPGHLLAGFTDILLQDGSSMAVENELKATYPGRFTANRPAAVELHTTMSVYQDQAVRVSLTPDVDGERPHLPEPGMLTGKLLMADRGYFDKVYLWRVKQAGGDFIVRGPASINPIVVTCTVNGRLGRRSEGRRLHDVLPRLRGKNADLIVKWTERGKAIHHRLVLVWNPDPTYDKHMLLLTSLDAAQFSVIYVRALYSLRWQVELLFKQWKSHANLRRFQTAKAGIVEGLIWASLAAAQLKRFLAHATQHICPGFQPSTHRAATALGNHLPQLIMAVLHHPRRISSQLAALIRYLASYAGRAHPKRDSKRGRLQTGLLCTSDAHA